MTQITEIQAPFSDLEKLRASELREEIERLLDSIGTHERSLSSDWVRLGRSLHEVRESKIWILWGYDSFGKYILEVGGKVNKGRSQIYQSVGVVEKLPGIPDDKLVAMGISKASELCKLTQAGRAIPRDLVDKAVKQDTTIDQVREQVFNALHAEGEAPGKYWDLGGFYVSPEEREEIQFTFDLARRVDPVIQNNIPDWAQRKEIMMRLIREFRATYEAEVNNSTRSA